MKNFTVIFLALTAAGCSSYSATGTRKSVGMSMILPNAGERMNLRENEAFLMPSPIEAGLPVYPEALSNAPPVTICAEIVVNERGEVDQARQIDTGEGCEALETDRSKSYAPAVIEAIRKWTFAAAAICHFEVNQQECDTDDSKLQIVPVKLAYRFHFTIENGVKGVSKTELDTKH